MVKEVMKHLLDTLPKPHIKNHISLKIDIGYAHLTANTLQNVLHAEKTGSSTREMDHVYYMPHRYGDTCRIKMRKNDAATAGSNSIVFEYDQSQDDSLFKDYSVQVHKDVNNSLYSKYETILLPGQHYRIQKERTIYECQDQKDLKIYHDQNIRMRFKDQPLLYLKSEFIELQSSYQSEDEKIDAKGKMWDYLDRLNTMVENLNLKMDSFKIKSYEQIGDKSVNYKKYHSLDF